MSRVTYFMAAAFGLLSACGQLASTSGEAEAALPCVDVDGDGFGVNCALGRDCDDRDPKSTNECRVCAHPEPGCACASDQPPIQCFLPDNQLPDGGLICHEGTRTCRNGLWSQCEDVRSYSTPPQEQPRATGLIDLAATPKPCTKCDVTCFEVTDNLLVPDAGAGDAGLTYGAGGGLQLRTTGMGTDAGTSGTGVGCPALEACCNSLGSSAAPARIACSEIVTDGNTTACTSAIKFYCPNVFTGPIGGCTLGNTIDGDCDGIPDAIDECTADTIDDNPNCDGVLRPLASTNNQTIFHVLDKGESANDSLEIAFQLRNADVYYLFDTSLSMKDERDKLIASMTTGDVVECALLKNCCDTLTGTAKTNCDAKVAADVQSDCVTAQATHCAGKPQLLDCPDLDLNGSPDNTLKTQGVLGATRCLVGASQFGTGTFLEIPFRNGKSLIGDRIDTVLFRDRGHHDEWAFRHYIDMTANLDVMGAAFSRYVTHANYDDPEGLLIALQSLITGNGLMFGHKSVSVAERLGAGCPANTFGYPCFRKDAVPIVVVFTDDSMNNGPTYTPPSGLPEAKYDASYSLNGNVPTGGVARFVPRQAETFETAYDLGDIRDKFVIAAGDLRQMTGNYDAAVTGCNTESAAPEAVLRFQIPPGTSPKVRFVANVWRDETRAPWHPLHALYSTYDTSLSSVSNWATIGYEDTNAPPSPATEWPVVLTLYRGADAGARVNCQTICPNYQPKNSCKAKDTTCSAHADCCSGNCSGSPKKCVGPDPWVSPFNTCRPLTDSCTAAADCCSGTCTASKCVGTDPPGSEQACLSTQLNSKGFFFEETLAPDTYYLTVKSRRAADAGFFELQIGDPAKGDTTPTTYTPPSWTTVRDLITSKGVKVLPIVSCDPSDPKKACDEARDQLRTLAQASGAVDAGNQGLVQYINKDGTGLGSKLALSIRDLANTLSMNISLAASGNPGFGVAVQKCTNLADATQSAVCRAFTSGCTDISPVPKNTIAQCKPGAVPKFAVQITNPAAPSNVPPNPDDPYGGYHFKLDLVGNGQYLLQEFPVYIIPTSQMGPPVANAGTYQTTGSYEQTMVGEGCYYFLSEGEAKEGTLCSDRMDNNGNGLADRGVNNNPTEDSDYSDPEEYPPDPGCMPGSCLDGADNDGDGLPDLEDPNCFTTEVQDWTDLFFEADMPAGTSITFEMCTADSQAGLATCSYVPIATVTSSVVTCGSHLDCKGIVSGGSTPRDGFCGAGGQCQFLTPTKMGDYCRTDAACPQGPYKDFEVISRCDTMKNQCAYATPPADVGTALGSQNGKPFSKVRISLNANADRSATPVLNSWNLEYHCRSAK